MPYSDPITHLLMAKKIQEIIKKSEKNHFKILDCGVGAGMIGKTISKIPKGTGKKIEIIGIEIYDPYINDPKLIRNIKADHSCYDKMFIDDFSMHLEECEQGEYDIVIFGDSLEHLKPGPAESTLAHALIKSNIAVIVNAPIRFYKQEPVYGNMHESHMLHWKRDNYELFGGVYLGGNNDVGSFYWEIPDFRDNAKYLPRVQKYQHNGPRFSELGELLW